MRRESSDRKRGRLYGANKEDCVRMYVCAAYRSCGTRSTDRNGRKQYPKWRFLSEAVLNRLPSFPSLIRRTSTTYARSERGLFVVIISRGAIVVVTAARIPPDDNSDTGCFVLFFFLLQIYLIRSLKDEFENVPHHRVLMSKIRKIDVYLKILTDLTGDIS